MPFSLNFGVDGEATSSFATGTERITRAMQERTQDTIAKVHTAAMREVIDAYKKELRADIQNGGFVNGAKLAKTWRSQIYPSSSSSMEPAGFIWTKATAIIDAFSYGVTIEAHGAHYLAIPQGAAKAVVRRLNAEIARSPRSSLLGRDDEGQYRDLGSYVQRVAEALGVRKLDLHLDRRTGNGVLVAAGTRLTKRGLAAKTRGDDTVLFVLVRRATLKRRIKGRELLGEFGSRFGGDFDTAVKRIAGGET